MKIFLMSLKHLSLTFVFESLVHNLSLQTVTKACLKSVNVQKSLFLSVLAISIELCKIKRLSVVEKPSWEPAWQESIISSFSR